VTAPRWRVHLTPANSAPVFYRPDAPNGLVALEAAIEAFRHYGPAGGGPVVKARVENIVRRTCWLADVYPDIHDADREVLLAMEA